MVARFFQEPPELGNQWDDDALLREYLGYTLPQHVLGALTPELSHLGDLGGRELYRAQIADRLNEPKLTQWDAWGHRLDHIELTPLWKHAKGLTAEHGLVATAYATDVFGPLARVVQFAKNHLVQASLDVWSCPLAMTDGAARTLLDSGNTALIDRAVPRLTSRDPSTMWTSGQWMTERTGGSDVSRTETIAKKTDDGWALEGTKWFTSATTSEMALTLARPEGNAEGSRGLALFFVELRDAQGRLQGIEINRLKDKLGTKKVPTAELTLHNAPAIPVAGLDDGVRKIASMLNVTRLWNAMGATWGTRRAVALAQSYARKRVVSGALLAEKPLHLDTLAEMASETSGVFLFAFRIAELTGRIDARVATDQEIEAHRALTPIMKLTTGKQAVAVASETLECFGGAGYVEDTGLPRILADAQVLPIWEGTTNVLSLDTLRALAKPSAAAAMFEEIGRTAAAGSGPALQPVTDAIDRALAHAQAFLGRGDRLGYEAGARQVAMTLGRTYEAALLARHAARVEASGGDARRAIAQARRFARGGIDRLLDLDPSEAAAAAL